MFTRVWIEEEDERLKRVWGEKGSLKILAAKHFPGRTGKGIADRARRIGLPTKRGNLGHGQVSYCAMQMRKAIEENGPLTCYELESAAGVKMARAQEIVREWLENGECHVVDWRRRSSDGQWSAAYALGNGENIPKPARKSIASVKRDWYARRHGKKRTPNPFAAAAGLVTIPQGQQGRVINNCWDDQEAA
ncbi:hypothetical protein AB4Y32_16125 [Paraburkholderia phymatum]|uniref:Uncharacterized protein n=1 Tax=Paraburkholderia phymatum TaxID=148447 RepID=A0ACC6U141_9BURK